jgi:coenzyme F420-reducing hydrogenase delta subunit
MRLQYPANVKIIRLPCTGKLDVQHLLDAFEGGVDGVFVAGCLEGDCHFLNGNLMAKRRVAYVQTLLDEIGLGGQRVEMHYMSAAMGGKFAETVREVTERVKSLGPSPLRKGGGAT